MLSFHHEGGAKRSSPSRSRVFLFKEGDRCPPAGGRGMHPPFLFFLKKRNGPCTVQRETAWGLKLDRFGSSLGQNGGRARRCPRKPRVPYRVRRTPAEQRWCFPAFGGLRVAFGGGYRKAPASLSALISGLRAAALRRLASETRLRAQPLRLALPGRYRERQRKETQTKSVLYPTSQFLVAGHGLKHLARPNPRPTLRLKVFCAVSCWDSTFRPKLDPKAGQV